MERNAPVRIGDSGDDRPEHSNDPVETKIATTAQATILPIERIIVGERRHRRDMGDLDGLARSIAEVGLLHPIVVRPAGTLIAGERRLRATQLLGWTSIPVTAIDLDAVVRGEYAENAFRKDFLPSEIDAIRRAIEPIEKAAAKTRMSDGGKGAQIALPSKTSAKIAAFANVSPRTVEKIKAVVEAAETEPQQYGHLIEELDRYRGVDRAYRALRCARDEARVLGLQPRQGKFRTLIVDVPWEYDNDWLGRGAPQYALMGREQALALPVASWAEEASHLYLWATNANLPLAVECMAAWGFTHKSVLTWVKPRFGLGKFTWAEAAVTKITARNVMVRYAGKTARLYREELWRYWAFWRGVRFVSSRTGRIASALDQLWQKRYGGTAGGVPPSLQMPLADAIALLGVPADYTRDEVLAAFRREAKKAHPDAGGTDAQFRRLIEARDRLLAAIGTSAPPPKAPRYAPSGVRIVYRRVRTSSRALGSATRLLR